MLRIIVGVAVLSSTLALNAWSKCPLEGLENVSTSSVNIPLSLNGKTACYHQKSYIEVKAESVQDGKFINYEITPVVARFENIPAPKIYQYVNIEYDQKGETPKFHMMSFLCSGESPIGGDAFSGSLQKLAENSTSEDSADVFIATGQASDNLSVDQIKKVKAKVYDKFIGIYESLSPEGDRIDSDLSNLYIPNILTGISVNTFSETEKKNLSSYFSRTGSSINGCSMKFINLMQEHLIHNVLLAQPFKDIDIKRIRRSPKLLMKWMI